MRAFSLYICDRSKQCLFHKDWTPTVQDEAAAHNNFITLYGLFFQMKLFATAADPTKPTGDRDGCKPDGMRPVAIGEGTGFRCVHIAVRRCVRERAAVLAWLPRVRRSRAHECAFPSAPQ